MVVSWLTLLLLAAVPEASVAQPVCFPERTVLWAAELHSNGLVFGGVRGGQVVRMLGESGDLLDLVEVETVGDMVVRGSVRKDRLQVFARREIEVEPGRTFWLPGAPMQILEGNANTARVTWAEPHGTQPPIPPVRVPCARLSGTSAFPFYRSSCNGARVMVETKSEPAGRLVEWVDGFSPRIGNGDNVLEIFASGTWLIKRRAHESWVEVVDEYNYLRVRRWFPNDKLLPPRPKTSGAGMGHGCCEGVLEIKDLPPSKPGGQLVRETKMLLRPDGAALATLPAGLPVRFLDGSKDPAWVEIRLPNWTDDYTMQLVGFVPKSAIAQIDREHDKECGIRGILGHKSAERRFGGFKVAASNFKGDRVEVTVADDGRFFLPVARGRWLLSVFDPDGKLIDRSHEAESFWGGADDVEIVLAH